MPLMKKRMKKTLPVWLFVCSSISGWLAIPWWYSLYMWLWWLEIRFKLEKKTSYLQCTPDLFGLSNTRTCWVLVEKLYGKRSWNSMILSYCRNKDFGQISDLEGRLVVLINRLRYSPWNSMESHGDRDQLIGKWNGKLKQQNIRYVFFQLQV